MKDAGMEAFRTTIAQVAPHLSDRVGELKDWEQIKLLTVQLNRLRQWHRPGLLCIGDAAHAMSPAGGVGINLAIQDAVATANLLCEALRERRLTEELLAQVQRRREFPTRFTQFLQVNAHRLFEQLFRNPGPAKAPWQLKVAVHIPGVQSLLGMVIGIGVRPEHIRKAKVLRLGSDKRLTKLAVRLGTVAGIAMRCIRGTRAAAPGPAAPPKDVGDRLSA
jgi:2-polyprenyl-6-methoxyphenol hydroxylase-like FAD-dependent oxidoreductase